jgi:hypothetical protein
MGNTTWNEFQINTYIKHINKLLERDVGNKYTKNYLADLVSLSVMKNFSTSKCFDMPLRYRDKIEEDIATLIEFEDFNDEIFTFNKNEEKIKNMNISYLKELFVNSDEILEFVLDFYKQFDKNYYSIVEKYIKEKKNNTIFTNNRSCTFSISTYGESFVNIEDSSDISEYFNAIHEYGHVIADSIVLRFYNQSDYPFYELMSMYNEFNAINYLEKVKPDLKNEIYKYKKSYLMTIIKMSKRIEYFYKYISNDSSNFKLDAILKTMSINKISYQEASKVINDSLYEKYIYLISFLTMIELLYIEDKDLAKYDLIKIISTKKDQSYINLLNNINITLNNNSNDFVNNIILNKKPRL